MENVGIFYEQLVHFMAIGNILWPFGIHILWSFGIFFPILVFCTYKNLASLLSPLKFGNEYKHLREHARIF
jgi:hypothetical protein